MRFLAFALLSALSAPVAVAVAQDTKPTVYIGPLVRDQFVDMDAGIRDSIRDIRGQAARAGYRVVPTEAEATVTLIVLGRGIVTAGSVGVSTASTVGGTGSGFGIVLPNEKPTIAMMLRVGTYTRHMHTEGNTWTNTAGNVVNDLDAWWEANSEAIQRGVKR